MLLKETKTVREVTKSSIKSTKKVTKIADSYTTKLNFRNN